MFSFNYPAYVSKIKSAKETEREKERFREGERNRGRGEKEKGREERRKEREGKRADVILPRYWRRCLRNWKWCW